MTFRLRRFKQGSEAQREVVPRFAFSPLLDALVHLFELQEQWSMPWHRFLKYLERADVTLVHHRLLRVR